MNSQSPIVDRDLDDDKVAAFRCQFCDFTSEDERIVRVHLLRSDNKIHQTEYGFMPEVTVEAINEHGEVIQEVPGNPILQHQLKDVTVDDISPEWDEREAIVLLTAIQNPRTKFSEVETLANDRLREQGFEEVDYSKAYRTVIDGLGLQRKGRDTSMSQAQEADKSYDDLTDKQRAVINQYIRDPDQSMSEIARKAGVDPSYPKQVIEKYGDLADEMTNADVVPVGDATDLEEEEEEQSNQRSRNDPTPTDQKAYDDLTELQRQVLDELVEHPDKSHKEIASDVGCDLTYPGKIEKNFEHIIEQRQRNLGIIEESVDEDETADADRELDVGNRTYRVPVDAANAYADLTQKQQDVVAELVKEDDPLDPETSRSDIGDAAGVHGTYVNEVKDKYGDIAVQIKDGELIEEREPEPEVEDEPEAESDAEPETEADSESEQQELEVEEAEDEEEPTEDTESTQEPEPAPAQEQTGTTATQATTQPTQQPSEGGAVPIEEIRRLRERMGTIQRTARSEIESGSAEGSPHGRDATATEALRELDRLLEEYGAEEDEVAATS